MSIVIDTPDGIAMFHYLTQYHACKLQLLGLHHHTRRSIIAHVKRTYGFTGRNESVVRQFGVVLRGHNPVAAMAARMDAVVAASASSVPRT